MVNIIEHPNFVEGDNRAFQSKVRQHIIEGMSIEQLQSFALCRPDEFDNFYNLTYEDAAMEENRQIVSDILETKGRIDVDGIDWYDSDFAVVFFSMGRGVSDIFKASVVIEIDNSTPLTGKPFPKFTVPTPFQINEIHDASEWDSVNFAHEGTEHEEVLDIEHIVSARHLKLNGEGERLVVILSFTTGERMLYRLAVDEEIQEWGINNAE